MGKLAVFKLMYLLQIVGTILIAVITGLGYLSIYANPNEYPAMAFLGLTLPILLIFNTILMFYWLIRWRKWIFLPIVAIVINIPYITSMYQLGEGEPSSPQSIKIMTLNAHSFNREQTGYTAKQVEKYAISEKLDILCFQEFENSSDFNSDSLRMLFSSFPYQVIPMTKGAIPLAILSKHPIDSSAYIPFPESNNNAVWADVTVNNKTIRVINVHMQTTNFSRTGTEYYRQRDFGNLDGEKMAIGKIITSMKKNFQQRAKQADIVQSIVKSTKIPIILCGDLNDVPSSYTYNTLKGQLSDGFKTCGSGYASTYLGFQNLLRIDYIFYSPTLKGLNYTTLNIDWSDHLPVIMEVEL